MDNEILNAEDSAPAACAPEDSKLQIDLNVNAGRVVFEFVLPGLGAHRMEFVPEVALEIADGITQLARVAAGLDNSAPADELAETPLDAA